MEAKERTGHYSEQGHTRLGGGEQTIRLLGFQDCSSIANIIMASVVLSQKVHRMFSFSKHFSLGRLAQEADLQLISGVDMSCLTKIHVYCLALDVIAKVNGVWVCFPQITTKPKIPRCMKRVKVCTQKSFKFLAKIATSSPLLSVPRLTSFELGSLRDKCMLFSLESWILADSRFKYQISHNS